MRNEIVRSPLFYVGDKYKLMREIRSHFPQQVECFVEPFVGGGSVFLNIEAKQYILNDIDSYVIAIHKMLCKYAKKPQAFYDKVFDIVNESKLSLSLMRDDVPTSLKTAYPKTYFAKYNKEAYGKLREEFNSTGKKDILLLYVLLIYGFNRMLRFNKSGDFNLPVGNVDFNKNTQGALDDYFEILKGKDVVWKNQDFRKFFGSISLTKDDLVYLDPPYLITFSEYNKLWNEQTEIDLLAELDELNGKGIRFAISNVTHYKGKTNDIFLAWAEKYNTHPIKSNYISFHDNTIKKFNEVLITNYTL